MGATTTEGERKAMKRPEIIELLNDALSSEYNSFIGHALASNPYVAAAWEADLKMLEELREDENDLSRALLVQFGRYRAGPTLKAFALWKEDLNFLSVEWLVIRAAKECAKDLAAAEARRARVNDDVELQATLDSVVSTKKRHLARLEKAAVKMEAARDARRATQRAVTAIKVPGIAGPAAKAAPAAAGAAPKKPSGGPAPKLPGGFKLPPGAPPPSGPKPPGAPSAPKAPPLPPGAKAPAAPKPPAAPAAPKKSTGAPPLPPGFKLPGS